MEISHREQQLSLPLPAHSGKVVALSGDVVAGR